MLRISSPLSRGIRTGSIVSVSVERGIGREVSKGSLSDGGERSPPKLDEPFGNLEPVGGVQLVER